MATPEDSARILQAIQERVPNVAPCAVCGTRNFTLGEGFVRLDLSELHSSAIRIGGPALPSVALVCQNCGNTILLNLIVLGLTDLAVAPPRGAADVTVVADVGTAGPNAGVNSNPKKPKDKAV